MTNSGQPINKTATGDIANSPGTLIGFYVNSTTSGTIVLRDGGSGGTVITGTMTPSAGWNYFLGSFSGKPHATIGGTLDVTFIFQPG